MDRPILKLLEKRVVAAPTTIPAPQWTPTNTEYHAVRDRWTSTGLRSMLENPRLTWERYVARKHQLEVTGAMITGRIVNDLLLQQHDFQWYEDTLVVPVQARSAKSFKERFAEDPRTVTKAEFDKACACLDSLASLDTEKKRQAWLLLTAPGYDEYAIQYDYVLDAREGLSLPVQVLLDRAADVPGLGGPTYLEVKTTGSAIEDDDFVAHAFRYGYDIQNALYTAGLELVTGRNECASVYVLLETEPPHRVNVLEAEAEYRELGAVRLDHAVRQVLRWKDQEGAGPWAAEWEMSDEIRKLTAPQWVDWEKYR